jgi:hypothetical protein
MFIGWKLLILQKFNNSHSKLVSLLKEGEVRGKNLNFLKHISA